MRPDAMTPRGCRNPALYAVRILDLMRSRLNTTPCCSSCPHRDTLQREYSQKTCLFHAQDLDGAKTRLHASHHINPCQATCKTMPQYRPGIHPRLTRLTGNPRPYLITEALEHGQQRCTPPRSSRHRNIENPSTCILDYLHMGDTATLGAGYCTTDSNVEKSSSIYPELPCQTLCVPPTEGKPGSRESLACTLPMR